MNIHIYHHIIQEDGSDEVKELLKKILDNQQSFTKKLTKMANELESLGTEVTEIGTVVDSAVVLIAGMADKIDELKDNPAALTAYAEELRAKKDELASAVAANTVAEEETPPA